ncbi:heterokaryon incompatibility protein-domain-containing protein [Dichomitus squalens]|uniref:Heterokaryon incompatibility protein-domain-containing protein n=1 Tax=Dichomitus squalens TaxID=114155 RepID=A0A4Q9N1L2_9APHY|nr:heterokaryon incompatibility protein-domain-containing protein [Dichomitus squalens]
MRLLDTVTGLFVDSDSPEYKEHARYAIFSHRWSSEGEQTYRELREIQDRYYGRDGRAKMSLSRLWTRPPKTLHKASKAKSTLPQPTIEYPELSPIWRDKQLSDKIRKACEMAREYGYRYIWIDSGCIDQSSSSEQSESINSMYKWYGGASLCLVYLVDVEDLAGREDSFRWQLGFNGSQFRGSEWFKRGWTLQELIAPKRVVFLSKGWRFLGTKTQLAGLLEEITSIDQAILLHQIPLTKISVANRMSWAAERKTAKPEDIAYSLLGIFDINMPTLYGEGDRAFYRLQEEILRRIPDQSIFAWTAWGLHPIAGLAALSTSAPWHSVPINLLAPSPAVFAKSAVDAIPHEDFLSESFPDLSDDDRQRLLQGATQSPYGMRIAFPVIPPMPLSLRQDSSDNSIHHSPPGEFLVLLACHDSSGLYSRDHFLARLCFIGSYPDVLQSCFLNWRMRPNLILLDRRDLSGRKIDVKTFHMGHPTVYIPRHGRHLPEGVIFALSSISDKVLKIQGYEYNSRCKKRVQGSPWLTFGISGGDLDYGQIVFTLVGKSRRNTDTVEARVDFVDRDDPPRSLDFSDISEDTLLWFGEDAPAPKRRIVTLLYAEGVRREVSSERLVELELDSGNMQCCVHLLLQNKSGQYKHLALRCLFQPITSLKYDVHIELFSSPRNLRQMGALAREYGDDPDMTRRILQDRELSDTPLVPPGPSTSARSHSSSPKELRWLRKPGGPRTQATRPAQASRG